MTQYAIATDLNRCVGCLSCMVACKAVNNVPIGSYWNKVLRIGPSLKEGATSSHDVEMYYLPVQCQHCADPACAKVCPVGATSKDPETGIVKQDVEKCIGCRMCMAACPYTGVRSFNWEEPRYYLDIALGEHDAPPHQKHTVEKCILCEPRLARGLEPACVEVCPGRARFFGNLEDPSSDVAKLVASREHRQILPEMGTNPSVYYLV